MRIITGTARGIRLETLTGDVTRPTIDRVKEAIFSMIQFDIEGRSVLDLFAGSGQLGLEALSRGAEKALFCDCNNEAFEMIKTNARKTKLYEKCRILKTDYKELIRGCAGREKFDLIFLDPPYSSDYLADALKRIKNADILAENGIIVCESEKGEAETAEGFSVMRFAKYGRVSVTLLVREAEI